VSLRLSVLDRVIVEVIDNEVVQVPLCVVLLLRILVPERAREAVSVGVREFVFVTVIEALRSRGD
jgi:hypothetical protein